MRGPGRLRRSPARCRTLEVTIGELASYSETLPWAEAHEVTWAAKPASLAPLEASSRRWPRRCPRATMGLTSVALAPHDCRHAVRPGVRRIMVRDDLSLDDDWAGLHRIRWYPGLRGSHPLAPLPSTPFAKCPCTALHLAADGKTTALPRLTRTRPPRPCSTRSPEQAASSALTVEHLPTQGC
jgi:hypothetical protein